MAEKKSFILYTDVIHTVKILSKEQQGDLFMAILHFANGNEPNIEEPIVKVAFEPIKQSLLRDNVKYDSIREKKRHAGLASAKARQKKSTKSTPVNSVEQKSTKPTVNVSASVNGSVIENENVSTSVDNKDELTAYEFLKEESPSIIEAFEMQNKKSFPDFDVFIQNFNSKVITEEIPFESKKLHARLMQLNANWDKNKKSKADMMSKDYGVDKNKYEPKVNRQTEATIRKNLQGW